jgi:hypothetical protein
MTTSTHPSMSLYDIINEALTFDVIDHGDIYAAVEIILNGIEEFSTVTNASQSSRFWNATCFSLIFAVTPSARSPITLKSIGTTSPGS